RRREALRGPGRQAGRRLRDAGDGRSRLLPRVPGRAAVARREAARDRRRHPRGAPEEPDQGSLPAREAIVSGLLARGLIAAIHLPALPGDPAYAGGGFAPVLDAARRDADAIRAGGIDAVVIENFGSRPFAKGDARDP